MSGTAIVAHVLAEVNVEEVLESAADKSQEELKALAASYRPVHGVPERIEPIAVRATPAEGPGLSPGRGLTKPRLEDLRLLCRVHNQEAARRAFGDDEIDRAIYGRIHRSGSAGSSSVSGSG